MDDLISSLKNGDVFKSKIKHSNDDYNKKHKIFNIESSSVSSNNAAKELLKNLDKGKSSLSRDVSESLLQVPLGAEPTTTGNSKQDISDTNNTKENSETKDAKEDKIEIDDDWLENSVNKLLAEISSK